MNDYLELYDYHEIKLNSETYAAVYIFRYSNIY